jgi:hypothetical protein
MTVEVHPTVENAMFDLDFYILVAQKDGYPVTEMHGTAYTYSRSRDVRCYRKIGTARSMRTKALKVAKRTAGSDSYMAKNVGLEWIRILHVHINLVDGTTESEWVE